MDIRPEDKKNIDEKFMDEVMEISLLYDFYGNLLSKRQRQVLNLYHEENLSLAEIAEEYRISRQGVYDALKNGEKSLRRYEAELGLVGKFESSRAVISKTKKAIDGLIEKHGNDSELIVKLKAIKVEINILD